MKIETFMPIEREYPYLAYPTFGKELVVFNINTNRIVLIDREKASRDRYIYRIKEPFTNGKFKFDSDSELNESELSNYSPLPKGFKVVITQ